MLDPLPGALPAPPEIPRPEGEPDGCEELAESLLRAAGRWADIVDQGRTPQARAGGWDGRTATAYRGASVRAAVGCRDDAAAARRLARRLVDFADALRAHRAEWDALAGQREALLAERAQLLLLADPDTGRRTDLAIACARLAEDADRLRRSVVDHETALRAAFARAVEHAGGALDSRIGGHDSPPPPRVPPFASPEQARDWWEGLSATERAALLAAVPALLGGLGGLPARVRDRANRQVLSDDLARLRSLADRRPLTPQEQQWLENAEQTAQALATANAWRDPLTSDPVGGFLLDYDPDAFDGDGLVTVSVGDPDTAEHVSVTVPGILTTQEDVVQGVTSAGHLYDEARNASGDQIATIFWLGYNAPEGVWDTITPDRAAEGGERLADTLDALGAARDDPAHVTVIGHSYGSTTAASGGVTGLDADEIVLLGSPGAGPAQTVDDLPMGSGHVFVASASDDPVTAFGDEGWLGTPDLLGVGLGVDPASEEFGAIRFGAEAESGTVRSGLTAHSAYDEPGSDSLHAIAQIVVGHPVTPVESTHDPWWGLPVDPERRAS